MESIEINIKVTGLEHVDWILIAQDTVQWSALVP
jgi:hypothetical protein